MKAIHISFLLVAIVHSAYAQTFFVSRKDAMDIACRHYALSKSYDRHGFEELKPELLFERTNNDTTTWYAVGFSNRPGKVFVSATELAYPIIGSTATSGFDTADVSPALLWLLRKHENKILELIRSTKSGKHTPALQSEWEEMRSLFQEPGRYEKNDRFIFDTVGPLVTAHWGQTDPYNKECPMRNFGTWSCRTKAGCGPIAMAQLMHYNEYPPTYNWRNMPNAAPLPTNDVAKLIRDCGDYAKSVYYCDWTATHISYIDDAMRVFGYQTARHDDDIDEPLHRHRKFTQNIRGDLVSGFPVIVDGYEEWNISDWHLFILDGYTGTNDEAGKFHINWGWFGSDDGWYRLDNCDPPGSGGPYNYNQGVVWKLHVPGEVKLVNPAPGSAVRSFTDIPVAWLSFGRAGELDSVYLDLDINDYKVKGAYQPENRVRFRVANNPGQNVHVIQLETPLIARNDSVAAYMTVMAFGNEGNNYKHKYVSEKVKFYLKDGEYAEFISPTNSSVLVASLPTFISWHYNENVNSVTNPTFSIRYYKVSGPSSSPYNGQIISNQPGTSCTWMVPFNLQGTYKLEGYYTGDAGMRFWSEPFTVISGPEMNQTIPAANSQWVPGTTMDITWTTNFAGNVRIKLTRLDDWNPADTLIIAESAPNNGSYSWPIPENITPGVLYTMEIRSLQYPDIYSGVAFFTIRKIIDITAPMAESVVERGKNFLINWVDNFPENVRLYLYKAGALQDVIATNTESDGSYSWFVPNFLQTGGGYQIKIESVLDASIFDWSHYFTISDPGFINILSPAPNAAWDRGETHTINWTHNVTNFFKIELLDYSTNPAGTTVIENLIYKQPEGYQWAVPVNITPGSLYKIKLSEAPGLAVTAESEYFSIAPGPTITVTSPNATSVWRTAQTRTIEFDANFSGPVNIDLYKQSLTPSLVSRIATNHPSTSNYSWGISQDLEPGTDYYIRISSPQYNVFSDSEYFTIQQGAWVRVDIPEAGAQWASGTSQQIYFVTRSANRPFTIRLKELSLGINEVLATGVYSSIVQNAQGFYYGTYTWSVPGNAFPSANYKIEVMSELNSLVVDQSDPFTIYSPSGYFITIIQPNDTCVWKAQTQRQVQIERNFSGNFWVYLYKGENYFCQTIAYTSSNNFSVNVPDGCGVGADFRLKAVHAGNSDIFGFSEYFEITLPDQIQNISTSTTEIRANDSVWIYWEDNLIENVKIELMHTDSIIMDTVYHLITPSTESDGSYLWGVPGNFPFETWFKLKVSSINTWVSNKTPLFKIHFPHFIHINTPTAGQDCLNGETYPIDFDHNFIDPNEVFRIQLYDGDEFVKLIDDWVNPGGNNYFWNIDESYMQLPFGNSYRIKVFAMNKPEVFSFSDPFTLVQCHQVDFSLGADTTIALDEGLYLIPTDGFESYYWPLWNYNGQLAYVTGNDFGLGTHAVICHATLVEGCMKTDTMIISVTSNPCFANAMFRAIPLSGISICDTYQFICVSDSTYYYQLEWDFGDGTTLNTHSLVVEHTFPGPGEYLVTFKNFDPDYEDCYAEHSETIVIQPSPEISLSHEVSIDTVWLIAGFQGVGDYRVNWILDGQMIKSILNPNVYSDTLVYVFPENAMYRLYAEVYDTLYSGCVYKNQYLDVSITDIPLCRSTRFDYAVIPKYGYGSGNRNAFEFYTAVNHGMEQFLLSIDLGDGSPPVYMPGLEAVFDYAYEPGVYVFTITLENFITGCFHSINDTVIAQPVLDAGLPDYVEDCDETVLQVNEGGHFIHWCDSSNVSSRLVSASGDYWVLIIDSLGFYRFDSTQVSIFNSPDVFISPLPVLCGNEELYFFSEGIPVGGTYSGNHISGNIFNIAGAGPGFHIITYHFMDTNGCEGTAQSILEVETAGEGPIYLQNIIISEDSYFSASMIQAGSNVTGSMPPGPFVVAPNGNVYLKAGTNIILKPGTHIQSSAGLKAVILPLNCTQLNRSVVEFSDSAGEVETNIYLYPNPTQGLVTLLFDNCQPGGYTLEVFDSRGQKVMLLNNITDKQATFDLSNYTNGLYFVRVFNAKSAFNVKMIKN